MTQATTLNEHPLRTSGDIPQIYVTKDYGRFQELPGNRTVDYNHVKRLKREMEANRELLASNPILVNEHLGVIDGQHRLAAAKELDLPLYYLVSKGASIDHTRHLNSTQKRWTLLDFAQSYADSKHPAYVEFLKMHERYPDIAPSILQVYLQGSQRKDSTDSFRRGEFQIDDLETAKVNVERLSQVMKRTHNAKMTKATAVSLLALMSTPDNFNFDVFLQKLDKEAARERFTSGRTVKEALRSIEDVYNFQSRFPVRLY